MYWTLQNFQFTDIILDYIQDRFQGGRSYSPKIGHPCYRCGMSVFVMIYMYLLLDLPYYDQLFSCQGLSYAENEGINICPSKCY